MYFFPRQNNNSELRLLGGTVRGYIYVADERLSEIDREKGHLLMNCAQTKMNRCGCGATLTFFALIANRDVRASTLK